MCVGVKSCGRINGYGYSSIEWKEIFSIRVKGGEYHRGDVGSPWTEKEEASRGQREMRGVVDRREQGWSRLWKERKRE